MPPILRSNGGGGEPQFRSVLLVSLAFMLVFTSFQTMGNIEEVVLKSMNVGSGYISLAVIYVVFALSNWLAPSVVVLIGLKGSMIAGGILYALFIASFLYLMEWSLYTMSALLGIGAALIWTAQGSYLTRISTPETMSRNSGVFWAILQCSMFLGNSFVFWQFEGKRTIDGPTCTLVFSVLTGVAILGVICLCFLTKPPEMEFDLLGSQPHVERPRALNAFKKSIHLFTQKEMILLFWTFLYSGIELSFFSGVYSAAIGFTNQLGSEAKRLVPLCGILVGAGEVLGGFTFGLFGSKTVKKGSDPIVLLGFVLHSISYFCIFLNLPNESPLRQTDELAFINPPSPGLAMFSAFLLGLGDACFNTQIYSTLGGLWPDDSAPAFALFKFTQSVGAAASFFYSSLLSLRIQLGLLQLFATIGSYTFFIVEWEYGRLRRDQEFVHNLIHHPPPDEGGDGNDTESAPS